ncbi:hypothetical protein O0L34_g4614 [Tuta absoluta]|nr:hypothetical protein O0L34_g4614 [Tuta absoluta]
MRAPVAGVASVAGVEAWGSASAVCDVTASNSEPPFLYLPAINQRFAIWQGDITTLEVDAITNSTDESLLQHDPGSDRILQNAGSELKEEIISRSLECRTGEAVVTPGFALRCRHIIHTVCPKYVPKYHTAAETSLHNCYKNVLHKAGEIGARSLALCVLNTPKRNFPPDVAAHIALRTIRRYLEQSSRPQIVVIATSNSGDAALYTALAPLYFPRSDRDATAAAARLRDIGGPCGEPSHPERRIRIIHNPHSHADSTEDDTSLCDEEAAAEAAAAFARAAAPDTQRLLPLGPRPDPTARRIDYTSDQ